MERTWLHELYNRIKMFYAQSIDPDVRDNRKEYSRQCLIDLIAEYILEMDAHYFDDSLYKKNDGVTNSEKEEKTDSDKVVIDLKGTYDELHEAFTEYLTTGHEASEVNTSFLVTIIGNYLLQKDKSKETDEPLHYLEDPDAQTIRLHNGMQAGTIDRLLYLLYEKNQEIDNLKRILGKSVPYEKEEKEEETSSVWEKFSTRSPPTNQMILARSEKEAFLCLYDGFFLNFVPFAGKNIHVARDAVIYHDGGVIKEWMFIPK